MKPSIFKRCGCRDPFTGVRLGNTCPKLRRGRDRAWWSATHGTWHYRLELPSTIDGRRRQLRRGGFTTRDATLWEGNALTTLIGLAHHDRPQRIAIADLVISEHRAGRPLPSPSTVDAWMHTGIPPAST